MKSNRIREYTRIPCYSNIHTLTNSIIEVPMKYNYFKFESILYRIKEVYKDPLTKIKKLTYQNKKTGKLLIIKFRLDQSLIYDYELLSINQK